MKKTELEALPKNSLRTFGNNVPALLGRHCRKVRLGQSCPRHMFQRQNPAGTRLPVHIRKVNFRIISKIFAEPIRRPTFMQQVHFPRQFLLKLTYGLDGTITQFAKSILRQASQLHQNVHVGLNGFLDARPQNLQHHACSIGQHRRMHLRNRRGGQRCFFDGTEQYVQPITIFFVQPLPDLRVGDQRTIRTQATELVGQFRRNKVRTSTQDLPQFDKRATQFFKSFTHAYFYRSRSRRIEFGTQQDFLSTFDHTLDTGVRQDLSKSMLRQDRNHFGRATSIPDAATNPNGITHDACSLLSAAATVASEDEAVDFCRDGSSASAAPARRPLMAPSRAPAVS